MKYFRRYLLWAAGILLACTAVVAGLMLLWPSVFSLDSVLRLGGLQSKSDAGSGVYSNLLNFDVAVLNGGKSIDGEGGDIAPTDKGLLLARAGDGTIFLFGDDGAARPLSFKLPKIRLPAVGDELLPGQKLTEEIRSKLRSRMRYEGLLLRKAEGRDQLVVTHTQYLEDRKCFVFQLEVADLPANWSAADGPAEVNWRVAWASDPCLRLATERSPFAGHESGGGMVVGPDGSLLLAVGDFEFDGLLGKTPALAQESPSSYGRVWKIDPDSGTAEQLSQGHRNPQGMTLDLQGRLWAVEHGPQGGDELNLISAGNNYGWPLVSLGVFYSDPDSDVKVWPLSKTQGRHDGFVPPVFSWTPSIAPSGMTVVSGVDPLWDGDLLLSTLRDKSLRRLRLDDTGHVQYDERIPMDDGIRDIEVADGKIYLLFDEGTVTRLMPRSMGSPEDWFKARSSATATQTYGCLECHANPGLPRLRNIVGSKIASQDGVNYSDALKAVGGTWTADRLSAFLNDPQSVAPGTAMPRQNLSKAQIEELVKELTPQ